MNKLKIGSDLRRTTDFLEFYMPQSLYSTIVFDVPFDLESQMNELLLLRFKYVSSQLVQSHKLRFIEG